MIQIADFLDKLQSEDEADRIYAAEDIGYANDAAGIEPLFARLPGESSRAVREAIFAALSQIEADPVIEGSIGLLDSEDPFLRNQAVEILRARGVKAIPYLDTAFREGDGDRRKFVIDVLGKLRASEDSSAYDLALQDSDINVIITAVESLGETGKTAFRGRVEALVSKDAHPMLTCACMTTLAQIGEPSSLDVVRAALGPASGLAGFLLPCYLKLLGAQGLPCDVSEAADLLHREALVGPALNALTVLRTRHAGLQLPVAIAEPLRKIAGNETAPLPYQAVRLLGLLLNEPSVFEFVEECLDSPDKSIRIGAVRAMRVSSVANSEAVLRKHLSGETDAEVLHAWGGKGGA